MALLNIAGDHGKALRVTDSVGGCISMGQAILGTDAAFRGPIASFGFGFRSINAVGGGAGFQCRVGIGDGGDSTLPNRLWLEVVKNDPDLIINAWVQTTSCGLDLIATQTIAIDATWHSCGLSYDEGGDYHFYVDGVEEDTGAVPCADFGEDAVAGTRWLVWGSIVPGVEIFYLDDVFFSDELAPASQFLDYFNNGLP